LIGGVRRQHRQIAARHRHAFRFGASDFISRDKSLHAVEDAVPRRAGGRGIAIRAAHFRRLRERHQQRGFAQCQAARLLAEIRQRRGADAFQIAAIGRKGQIQRENFGLAEREFEFERTGNLPEFGGKTALLTGLQQPRHLH
jgi:hypothetical protein